MLDSLDEVLTYEEAAGDEGRACPCPFSSVGFVCVTVVDRQCNFSLLKFLPLRLKILFPGAQLTVSTSIGQHTVQFRVEDGASLITRIHTNRSHRGIRKWWSPHSRGVSHESHLSHLVAENVWPSYVLHLGYSISVFGALFSGSCGLSHWKAGQVLYVLFLVYKLKSIAGQLQKISRATIWTRSLGNT